MSFTADEEDCLVELMNMAYGATASAVADTIDAFSTLHVPQLTVLGRDQLMGLFGNILDKGTIHFVSSQPFLGGLEGEVLFILSKESATNLVKHLDDAEPESDNDLADAAMELCNIITSSTMKNLAESLHTTVELLPPSEFTVPSEKIQDLECFDKYSHLILISTVMEFKDQNINGQLLILCQDSALIWLKAALNKVLNELGQ